jgi:phospholipid transport system substrate-binding protein
MRSWRWFTLFILLLALGARLAAAAPVAPLEEVRSTIEAVLELLRDRSLDPAQRRGQITQLVRSRFDFTSMSQRILATHWRSATPQEQQRFVTLFSDLLEANYIGRVEDYSNETVRYLGQQIIGERASIDTAIVTASGEIPIAYRLQRSGERWMVYDVVIEGVSFVSNYRSTYGEIVRREGMAGLLRMMEEKLAEVRSGQQRQDREGRP